MQFKDLFCCPFSYVGTQSQLKSIPGHIHEFKWETYILHVSRETLRCGGDGTLYFPQKVFLRLWTGHILLHHEVSKSPAQSEDRTLIITKFI